MKNHIQQQAISIPIIKIAIDRSLQIRNEMLPWKIEEYKNKYRNEIEMKPLIVGERGEGYVLIAGFHRLAALKRAGFYHADAIITSKPQSEWAWLAIESNLSHGIPLKASEIRKAFRVLIKSGGNVDRYGKFMSYDEVAKKLGGSKTRMTIYNWMVEDFPEIAKHMSSKGLMLKKKDMEVDDEMRDEKIINEMNELIGRAVALSRTIVTEDGRERFDEELKRLLREIDEEVKEDVDDDDNPDF